MMDYLRAKRNRSSSPAPPSASAAEVPVLNEEDEAFLHRIAEEGTPPELPERHPPPLPRRPQDLPQTGDVEGNTLQVALLDDARNVQLPEDPESIEGDTLTTKEPTEAVEEHEKHKEAKGKKSKWSFLRRDSRDSKRKTTANDLMSAAEGLKAPDAQPNEDGTVSDPEAKKEEEEMTRVLDDLNLAAVNNRVFSLSGESQELLHKFNLVLKDLINGVPTAYGDLESLLTNSEGQLQRMYTRLPPWLQKLVEQLPSKVSKGVAPEVLAAAAEKHGVKAKYANMAAKGAEKAGVKIRVPSLKDLVTKPGAIAGLLKAIMNFLKLRFPAFLGMNVLYSLALFVLLFVLWYCHKRGREVRLERERGETEDELAGLEDEPRVGVSSTDNEADAQKSPHTDTTKLKHKTSTPDLKHGDATSKQAEVAVAVVTPDDDENDENNDEHSERSRRRQQERTARKEERRAARWKGQPSKAPLESQESCVVC